MVLGRRDVPLTLVVWDTTLGEGSSLRPDGLWEEGTDGSVVPVSPTGRTGECILKIRNPSLSPTETRGPSKQGRGSHSECVPPRGSSPDTR